MKVTYCDKCGTVINEMPPRKLILQKSPIDNMSWDVCKKCYETVEWWMTDLSFTKLEGGDNSK